MARSSLTTVVGRDAERAALRAFVAGRERAAALVLEGEQGIGKSVLLEEALRESLAAGCRVLRCRPAAAEARLPHAALADLLGGGVLDEALPSLPGPQRRALRVALLCEEAGETPVDARAIATALLAVVHHAAARTPLVLAIDDAQWLDPASRDVLAFAARRTGSERAVWLIARRAELDEELPLGLERALPERRVTRLALGPLDRGPLHRLLEQRLGLSLARPALRRLHRASGGNPRYALELGCILRRRRIPLGLDDDLPVPSSLRRAADARLARLPAGARGLLAYVAALHDRSVGTVESVARAEGLDGALDRAIAAGVLELSGDQVVFTHGLLEAVVRADQGPERRAELHRRLAMLEPAAEARVLHRALAARAPDRRLAAELERAARRASADARPEAAARLAEHGSRLTPAEDPELAARRAISAADLHVVAGDPTHAAALLGKLVRRLEPGPTHAEALSLLAWMLPPSGDLVYGVELAEQALAEAGAHPRLAGLIHQRLSTVERLRGRLEASEEHGRRAVAIAEREEDAGLLALALASYGHTRLLLGGGVGPELRRAVAIEHEIEEFLGQQTPSWRLGLALIATDEHDEARTVLGDLLERAIAAGHQDARAMVLGELSDLERRAGDWERALALAEQARELSQEASTQQEQNANRRAGALLAAGLGRVEDARAAAQTGLAVAEQLDDRISVLHYRGALGLLELSLGNVADAAAWLTPATDELRRQGTVEHGPFGGIVSNEVEALVALDECERACELTTMLEELAHRTGRPWARAMAARSRALLLAAAGDLAGARVSVEAALAAHASVPQPLELARTLTLHGALERRAKQRSASRAALERALAIFAALPAPLWTVRAERELERLGVRPARGHLSATEARIASLVTDGLTNSEIAAAMFVSRKTVEANLTKVYRKLGVRSRIELTRRHFTQAGISPIE